MRLNIEFPCGYKINYASGVLDISWLDFEMPDRCPIHGKDCGRKIK